MMRIGTGYDSHIFTDEPNRPLVLGGVTIPSCCGLKAHSDGDVLLHAIIDALLGAAALGDIGSHFPDTDERWQGADSAMLLAAVANELSEARFAVSNIDATVICEKPKLRPHIHAIRSRIAEILKIDIGRVSVKGKTNEKMDDVGAGIGIVAQASVLINTISEADRI